MGLKAVLAKADIKPFHFTQNDNVHELGQQYHYFGVYAEPGFTVADKERLLRQWIKMVKYCQNYQRKPVAVFALDNQPLSAMAKHVGILTVCLENPIEGEYNKVVLDQPAFADLPMCYWVAIPDSETPELVRELEQNGGEAITVIAEEPNDTNIPKMVDPVSRIKQVKMRKPNMGTPIHIPDRTVHLSEPTVPLAIPPGLILMVQESENESKERLIDAQQDRARV